MIVAERSVILGGVHVWAALYSQDRENDISSGLVRFSVCICMYICICM